MGSNAASEVVGLMSGILAGALARAAQRQNPGTVDLPGFRLTQPQPVAKASPQLAFGGPQARFTCSSIWIGTTRDVSAGESSKDDCVVASWSWPRRRMRSHQRKAQRHLARSRQARCWSGRRRPRPLQKKRRKVRQRGAGASRGLACHPRKWRLRVEVFSRKYLKRYRTAFVAVVPRVANDRGAHCRAGRSGGTFHRCYVHIRKIFEEFSLRLKREKWYVCNSAVVSRTSCIYARFCLTGVVHEINFDVCMFFKGSSTRVGVRVRDGCAWRGLFGMVAKTCLLW